MSHLCFLNILWHWWQKHTAVREIPGNIFVCLPFLGEETFSLLNQNQNKKTLPRQISLKSMTERISRPIKSEQKKEWHERRNRCTQSVGGVFISALWLRSDPHDVTQTVWGESLAFPLRRWDWRHSHATPGCYHHTTPLLEVQNFKFCHSSK